MPWSLRSLKILWLKATGRLPEREPIDGLYAWELLPYEFEADWFQKCEGDHSLPSSVRKPHG